MLKIIRNHSSMYRHFGESRGLISKTLPDPTLDRKKGGGSAAPRERVVSRSTGTVPWNRVGRLRQDSVATPRYGDRAEPPVEASLDLPMPSSLASSTLSGAPHRGGLNGGR